MDLSLRDRVGGMFKYRAAALVTRPGQLLVCAVDGLDYTFPPGGKVRLGEAAHDAVRRELAEELGVELAVGDLLLVAENFYLEPGLRHELTFYYQVPWPHERPPVAMEAGHRFDWVDLDRLEEVVFHPAPLVPLLPDLLAAGGALPAPPATPRLPRHVVFDERPA